MASAPSWNEELKQGLDPFKRTRLDLVLRVDERLRDRYSCNTDYYYSTLVNTVMGRIGGRMSSLQIRYIDQQTDLDLDEFLKRPYMIHEYGNKMKLLSEYYKFHQDVPRVFNQPIFKILRSYHDRKRRLEYQRIKKMLAEEASRKNQKLALHDNGNEIGMVEDMADDKEYQNDGELDRDSLEEDTSNQDSYQGPNGNNREGEYQMGISGNRKPLFDRILPDEIIRPTEAKPSQTHPKTSLRIKHQSQNNLKVPGNQTTGQKAGPKPKGTNTHQPTNSRRVPSEDSRQEQSPSNTILDLHNKIARGSLNYKGDMSSFTDIDDQQHEDPFVLSTTSSSIIPHVEVEVGPSPTFKINVGDSLLPLSGRHISGKAVVKGPQKTHSETVQYSIGSNTRPPSSQSPTMTRPLKNGLADSKFGQKPLSGVQQLTKNLVNVKISRINGAASLLSSANGFSTGSPSGKLREEIVVKPSPSWNKQKLVMVEEGPVKMNDNMGLLGSRDLKLQINVNLRVPISHHHQIIDTRTTETSTGSFGNLNARSSKTSRVGRTVSDVPYNYMKRRDSESDYAFKDLAGRPNHLQLQGSKVRDECLGVQGTDYQKLRQTDQNTRSARGIVSGLHTMRKKTQPGLVSGITISREATPGKTLSIVRASEMGSNSKNYVSQRTLESNPYQNSPSQRPALKTRVSLIGREHMMTPTMKPKATELQGTNSKMERLFADRNAGGQMAASPQHHSASTTSLRLEVSNSLAKKALGAGAAKTSETLGHLGNSTSTRSREPSSLMPNEYSVGATSKVHPKPSWSGTPISSSLRKVLEANPRGDSLQTSLKFTKGEAHLNPQTGSTGKDKTADNTKDKDKGQSKPRTGLLTDYGKGIAQELLGKSGANFDSKKSLLTPGNSQSSKYKKLSLQAVATKQPDTKPIVPMLSLGTVKSIKVLGSEHPNSERGHKKTHQPSGSLTARAPDSKLSLHNVQSLLGKIGVSGSKSTNVADLHSERQLEQAREEDAWAAQRSARQATGGGLASSILLRVSGKRPPTQK